MTTLTPLRKLRVTPEMEIAPRSCTGWSCCCPAPYGFGDNRNKICHMYGPSIEASREDVEKHQRYLRAVYFRMKNANPIALIDKANRIRMESRRNKMMEKKREDLEWHLNFEDQCRTEGFFEARERQRAYEADAPARARRESFERYREAELESSSRSIRTLHFDD